MDIVLFFKKKFKKKNRFSIALRKYFVFRTTTSTNHDNLVLFSFKMSEFEDEIKQYFRFNGNEAKNAMLVVCVLVLCVSLVSKF